ncbi:radical SAM protein [Anaerocellum danielii]|uniref:Radical SAM protein n=1 Tax=Anaerocellum danielii TaxID=1387557 RepID=A0ABZ0U0W1_9FIRM|nr:radical SAM protein [Caldicellulosiruptor danielii]WPX07800.1 radical SAM protein [Caldicellulosiruptor danielii]
MKNKIVKGITPGGERTVLGEVLPLDTPFLIQIFPVYACNFRCKYCVHSLPKDKHGYMSNETFMDIELYKKCIDDMTLFNKKIKMLRFAGWGEPLLHPNIAEMVKYAKEKDIAHSVDIVTNGYLLNEKVSLALVEAGLDKLRISIEGLSEAKYKDICGVDIDFKSLIKKLTFFYKNRGNTKVYIKIIDCALENEKEKKQFFDIFGEIADFIAIEYLTPAVDEIDYQSMVNGRELNVTQNGSLILNSKICPQPFYMLQVNPDGNVVPCCSASYPIILGNVSEKNIVDIWYSKKFKEFQRKMLDGVKNASDVCSRCKQYRYAMYKEDVLDDYAEKLKSLFE